MICFNSYLASNIGDGCSAQALNFEARGYLIPTTAISGIVKYDVVMQDFDIADPTDIIPVFMSMDLPYRLTSEFTKKEMGFTSGDKTVELFIAPNTPLSHKQVMQLNNGAYILAMYDADGQIILVGADRGLRLTSSSQTISSVETHGGIMVTMTEAEAVRPQVFGGDIDIIPITGFTVDDYNVSGVAGGALILITAGFLPIDATIQGLNYKSLNPAVATVDYDNAGQLEIQPVAEGVTTVVVYTVDGNFKAEIRVTVTPAI